MNIVDTGRVFEIYSIGDGLYMRRIIDSIAAMSNAGVLLQLMGVSMMIGLLIMAFRNVAAGGSKLDLGSVLVSLILGTTMFGMKANVVIHDMNYAPGEVDNPSYTVANVPFGIAAAGYLVSNVSYELTLKMEQGFGLYTGSRSTLIEGGFGNTLEWINSLRVWEMPEFSDDQGDVPRFRNNLSLYMESCTKPALEMGHLKLDAILRNENIFTYGKSDGTGGIGYESVYLTTEYENADGTYASGTCYDMFQHIVDDSAGVKDAFAQGLSKLKLDTSTRGGDVQSAMGDAFNSVGLNADETQKLILAEVAGLTLKNAITGTASGKRLSAASKMMLEQASIQRSVQWASEETMFRKIMRPMMAFFESLTYALAPFMALAVGLGAYGIQTIGKYLMLSIWVSLWLPMLSIIELYQVTMMQHAVDAMRHGLDGVQTGVINMTMVEQIRGQAIEWLSAGAAMAAFTPALTLALVWGGAVTASALAGQLRGGDTVNEKVAAPDAISPAAAVSVAPGAQHSATTGTTMSASLQNMPTINTSTASAYMEQSTQAKLQSSSTSYTDAVAQAFEKTYGRSLSAGAATGQSFVGGNSGAAQNGWDVTNQTSADKKVDAGRDTRATGSNGVQQTTEASGSAGVEGFGTGFHAAVTGRNSEAQEVANQIRATRSAGGGSGTSAGNKTGELFTSGQRLEESVARLAKSDANFARALKDSQSYQKAQTALDQAQASYSQSGSFEQRYGSGQNVSVATVANDYIGSGSKQSQSQRATQAMAAARMAGVGEQARVASGTLFRGIANEDQRQAAGAIYALYQRSQQPGNDANGQAARQAVSDILSGTVDVSSLGQGAVKPGDNAGMQVGTPDRDGLIGTTEDHARGPGFDPEGLKREVGDALKDGSPTQRAMAAEAQGAVGADPTKYGPPPLGEEAAHDRTTRAGAAAQAVVEAQALDNAADGAQGLTQLGTNQVADATNVDGEGQILMYSGKLAESAFGGERPSVIGDRVAALRQTHRGLSESQLTDLAMVKELADHGAGNVTLGQYRETQERFRDPNYVKALEPYMRDQGGEAYGVERGLREEADAAKARVK